MTITIQLTETEEARFRAAAEHEGLEPDEFARKLVVEHLPSDTHAVSDPMLSLFAQWDEEDSRLSSEELAEESRSWDELKTQINAERDRAGARRVF